MEAAEDAFWKKRDMLGLYRAINRPDNMLLANRTDFGAALADPSPEHYGQRYVAGWEVRNLILAAWASGFTHVGGPLLSAEVGSPDAVLRLPAAGLFSKTASA